MPQSNPLSHSVKETLYLLGIGRTTLYALIKSGELTARKIGTKTIFLHEDLQNFLKYLPALPNNKQGGGSHAA